MTMTNVRVRAQAHGGKYLGPAVSKTPPVLTVLINGEQVGPTQTFPTLSSGEVVSQLEIGTSPYVIVVQPETKKTSYYPKPGTYWLQAPSKEGDADLIVNLDLTAPTAVEFRVTAYASDDTSEPRYGSITTTLIPGGDYTSLQPGLVVPVNGLRVFGLTATAGSDNTVNVQVTVEMMCGCPITLQPRTTPVPAGTEPYWPSTEFEVVAWLIPLIPFSPGGMAVLTASEEVASQFSGSTGPLLPGTYTVSLSAKQPGMMNTGAAITTVAVA